MLTRWILLISLIVYGCFTTPKTEPEYELPAPDGNTFVADNNGVLRPILHVERIVGTDETISIANDLAGLRGVAFDLAANSQPVIEVVAETSTPFRVYLYGPQTEQGLWGRSIYSASGENTLVIRDWRPATGGRYFLLARPNEPRAFTYSVTISCPECEGPQCVFEQPCNTYCPQGRALDATTGCLSCECDGASCAVDGCDNDADECVFRCGETLCRQGQTCDSGRCEDELFCNECSAGQACVSGACEMAMFECVEPIRLCQSMCSPLEGPPVCALINGEKRTVPNECLAACLNPSDVNRGPCMNDGCQGPMDCPAGQQCQAGTCVTEPLCDCADEAIQPVCGELDGERRTFQNRCEMDCEDYQLVYANSCFEDPTCQTSRECSPSHRCMPLPNDRIMGNREECERNPMSETCIRACVAKRRCDTDEECSLNERCVPNEGSGVCTATCVDDRVCNHDESCVFALLSPLTNDVGVCSTRCSEEGTCPGEQRCSNVQNVCVFCEACDVLPQGPLCHRGQRFESGCDLMCMTSVFDPTSLSEVGIEVCNNEDDDCDGRIDEQLGRPCDTDVLGCEEGLQKCVAGEWGSCDLVPTGAQERCNRQDDDCDGDIDEGPLALPIGETECPAAGPCDECDKDWLPVCTAEGLMPNECLAQCKGLTVLDPMDCGLRELPISRCTTDRDCARSICENPRNSICVGSSTPVGCVSLASTASCFNSTASPCLCDRSRGMCAYQLRNETIECIENDLASGMSSNGEPNMSTEPEPRDP